MSAVPRKEVSTGPGRHDFEIVADATLSVEDDMRRRDFTVNAMARRLATGELVDPLGGRADLEARRLRTVSPQSFREDPLRLVRALRFVSQLGFEPDEESFKTEFLPNTIHNLKETLSEKDEANFIAENSASTHSATLVIN